MSSLSLERKFYVYVLFDRELKHPFYVGKGCGKRAFCHLKPGSKSNFKKAVWIDEIRKRKQEPEIHYFLKDLNESEALEWEAILGNFLRDQGFQLTNIAPLGIRFKHWGSKSDSFLVLKRVSPKKGVPISSEHKKLLSLANKGKPHPGRLEIEKTVLEDLYLHEGMTRKAIGELYGTSVEPINRLLKMHGIMKCDTWAARRAPPINKKETI